jgi:hypothetical protein
MAVAWNEKYFVAVVSIQQRKHFWSRAELLMFPDVVVLREM